MLSEELNKFLLEATSFTIPEIQLRFDIKYVEAEKLVEHLTAAKVLHYDGENSYKVNAEALKRRPNIARHAIAYACSKTVPSEHPEDNELLSDEYSGALDFFLRNGYYFDEDIDDGNEDDDEEDDEDDDEDDDEYDDEYDDEDDENDEDDEEEEEDDDTEEKLPITSLASVYRLYENTYAERKQKEIDRQKSAKHKSVDNKDIRNNDNVISDKPAAESTQNKSADENAPIDPYSHEDLLIYSALIYQENDLFYKSNVDDNGKGCGQFDVKRMTPAAREIIDSECRNFTNDEEEKIFSVLNRSLICARCLKNLNILELSPCFKGWDDMVLANLVATKKGYYLSNNTFFDEIQELMHSDKSAKPNFKFIGSLEFHQVLKSFVSDNELLFDGSTFYMPMKDLECLSYRLMQLYGALMTLKHIILYKCLKKNI